jgi:hypothetical protein
MRDTVFVARRHFDDKEVVVGKTTEVSEGRGMPRARVIDAFQRLTGSVEQPDLETAVAAVGATAVAAESSDAEVDASELLDALLLLRWAQTELATLEPQLITAARAAGISWQDLAPALGVASRQAAERRYLRLVPATADQQGSTRDGRVRAERDRRAGHRAVAQWANDNTADLRRLAGQITALGDLDESAADDVGRLHEALAHPDASTLPGLLADARRYLGDHPHLGDQVDAVTARTDQVRRRTQQRRDGGTAG